METYRKRTFEYVAATQKWNSLPHHIRQSENVSAFKKAVITFLIKRLIFKYFSIIDAVNLRNFVVILNDFNLMSCCGFITSTYYCRRLRVLDNTGAH